MKRFHHKSLLPLLFVLFVLSPSLHFSVPFFKILFMDLKVSKDHNEKHMKMICVLLKSSGMESKEKRKTKY